MLSTLAVDRKRIADIDSKILEIGDDCAELLFEKESVQRLDDYNYPILTVPNEIVSEIFELLVPPYPVCPPQAGPFSPALLSHICSRWRQIALATPRLWRAIALSFSHGSKSTASRRQVELAEAWLRRSGCCPLSLEIHRDAFRELQRKNNGGHGQKIYTLIATHMDRWEYLRVSSSVIGRQVFRCSMPLLRSLALDGGRESPATAFADAPLLRSLSIRNNRFSYLWPPITLPWLQFTSLALDTSVLRSFAPMLKEFQNLTFFELTISNHGDLSDRDHIRLARLESLTLKDKRLPVIDSWREPHRILQHLVTPALQRLVVSTSIITRWRSDSAISALISFIKASACNLEELCITVTGNDIHLCDVERDLPVYRRAFPAIPKISLQTCTSTGEH
ncbi:hypothetical protein R3P38DRAFT_2531496 [Favolaschia claudopus]|uniref:F-box domain-containing protein n=1 Tax=Favolaschia claudopus TaxID=2862362 RepID=A0AAW0BCK4_9AGAR